MRKRTWKPLPAKKGHYPLGTIRVRGFFSNYPRIWECGENLNYIASWEGTAWKNFPPPLWWELEPDLFHEV